MKFKVSANVELPIEAETPEEAYGLFLKKLQSTGEPFLLSVPTVKDLEG